MRNNYYSWNFILIEGFFIILPPVAEERGIVFIHSEEQMDGLRYFRSLKGDGKSERSYNEPTLDLLIVAHVFLWGKEGETPIRG